MRTRHVIAGPVLALLLVACSGGSEDPTGVENGGTGETGADPLACAQAQDYRQQIDALRREPLPGDPYSTDTAEISARNRANMTKSSKIAGLQRLAAAAEESCSGGAGD